MGFARWLDSLDVVLMFNISKLALLFFLIIMLTGFSLVNFFSSVIFVLSYASSWNLET